jgi:hypothetical protein
MCRYLKTVLWGGAIAVAVILGAAMWSDAKGQGVAPEVCSAISLVISQGEAAGATVVKVEQKDLAAMEQLVARKLSQPEFKFDPRLDSIVFFFNVGLKDGDVEGALVLYADKNGCVIASGVGGAELIQGMLKELKGLKV